MINAGLLDASSNESGQGGLRLGAGYDSGLGFVGDLELDHRFNGWLYGFAKGSVRTGPRLDSPEWRAMVGLGGEWGG